MSFIRDKIVLSSKFMKICVVSQYVLSSTSKLNNEFMTDVILTDVTYPQPLRRIKISHGKRN